MPKKIIVRREGRYMQTLPHNFVPIRDWMRHNSPDPRYTDHAKKFTLEVVDSEDDVPAIVKPDTIEALSFEQYARKYAPHEDIPASA